MAAEIGGKPRSEFRIEGAHSGRKGWKIQPKKNWKGSRVIKGSCLCGAVTFAIEGDVPDLYQCHCSLCRKVTGSSANAGMVVPRADFRWIAGEQAIRSFVKATGYRNDFCATCGSSVPNPSRSGGDYWIPVGLLDSPIAARISQHVFVGSKAEWDEIGGGAPQLPGAPDSWN